MTKCCATYNWLPCNEIDFYCVFHTKPPNTIPIQTKFRNPIHFTFYFLKKCDILKTNDVKTTFIILGVQLLTWCSINYRHQIYARIKFRIFFHVQPKNAKFHFTRWRTPNLPPPSRPTFFFLPNAISTHPPFFQLCWGTMITHTCEFPKSCRGTEKHSIARETVTGGNRLPLLNFVKNEKHTHIKKRYPTDQ